MEHFIFVFKITISLW